MAAPELNSRQLGSAAGAAPWRLFLSRRAGEALRAGEAESSLPAPAINFVVARGEPRSRPKRARAARAASGGPRAARVLEWRTPQRLDWPAGERALVFSLDVGHAVTRHIRLRGPEGLAFALFAPAEEGASLPRSAAVATGVAGGATRATLEQPGVWALVLFQDGPEVQAGPVEIAFEGQGAQQVLPFLEDAHECRRFVLTSIVLAFALSLGEAGRTYLHTGNIWSSWVAVPFGAMFLLFPVQFLITMSWHTFRSMGVLRGDEPLRTLIFANRPLELDDPRWPSVTIQIPIFRERFAEVIRPTLDAAREAARRYREQTGARCNVLVCDDGLLYFARNDLERAVDEARRTSARERTTAQRELVARMGYYEAFDVAFVARPWPVAGVPGTDRPGRFRKASNLNYALRLADRLAGAPPLSEEHARFRDAVPERVYQLGRWRGDVSVGELIVQLDKDSLIAPDVIRATVPEFLVDPTLAFTQHAAYPTNEERYFSALIGWFTRLLYDLAIRAKSLVPGTMTPLMGHNVFLRRDDVMRVGAWYEHSVCEDLELMLRLQESGRHGKYIAYAGHEFGEAVTRVYTEELEKFRRYAYGAAEAVVNPIRDWERLGIVKESFRRFYRSEHVRWYQVFDMVGFFFSLINLASTIPLALITGLGLLHPYRALSMLVMTALIFGLSPLPACYLLRRRGALAKMPASRIWRTRLGGVKAFLAQVSLGYVFFGFSIAITRGALAYLFSRPLVFAETNADALGRLPRRAHLRDPAFRRASAEGAVLLVLAAVLGFWRIAYDPTYGVGKGFDMRFHLVWLFPLVVAALTPWIFHPYLVGGADARFRRQRRGVGAATAAPVGSSPTPT